MKRIMDMLPDIEKLRDSGIVRGERTGFVSLDKLYSVKEDSFTILLSEPGHGKSEFIMEICLNQAEHTGKRSLIFSPETGSAIEIVAELIHKHTGKSMLKSGYNPIQDKEFYQKLEWISEHFVLPEEDKPYSITELFEYAERYEKQYACRIHYLVGEPYNELDHTEMQKFGSRQDLYIEDLATQLRTLCKQRKKHFFLSLHPNGETKPVLKDGQTFYPKPLPRQAAGGQAWYRKAMTWITLWRPPAGMTNEAGWAYADNEVHVFIDKAKPKGVSFKGMCILYFDWQRNRYYESPELSDKYYAFQHPPEQQNKSEPYVSAYANVQPSLLFENRVTTSDPF